MKRTIQALLCSILFLSSPLALANVVLNDTEGHHIPFSSLKGKWVLINYWASWCQSCVDEIPALNHFYKKHRHDPIALFGVNYDSLPLFEQKNIIKQFDIAYPSLLGHPAEELNLGDIAGVPVTFIFNPQGKLAHVLFGGQTVKALEKALALR